MIIDIHTHAFPDALAAKTIPYLAEKAHTTPVTDGTADGLTAKLRESGVTLGLVLPVVTKPSQFETVNRYACSLSEREGLLSFGGIHPDDETPEEHLAQLRDMGLCGIKLHPDYQGVRIDDARYIRIAREAVRLGMGIVIHAGVDDGFPETVHCPPEAAARFLSAVYEGHTGEISPRIVLAHGGGNRLFDEVKARLAGCPVYFDLSYIFAYATPEEICDLIRAHGAEKILFGSDCPWGDPAEGIRFVKSLSLTDAEKEAILSGNACRFLTDCGVKKHLL